MKRCESYESFDLVSNHVGSKTKTTFKMTTKTQEALDSYASKVISTAGFAAQMIIAAGSWYVLSSTVNPILGVIGGSVVAIHSIIKL